jgi:hypothetical protein
MSSNQQYLKKLTKFKSTIFNRHVDQPNNIFSMANMLFWTQHTQISLKIYADPSYNFLPSIILKKIKSAILNRWAPF